MESLEVTTVPLVTEFDSSKVSKPTQGSLDRIPCFAETTAMLVRPAQRGQHRMDPKESNQRTKCFRTITGITLESDRLLSWASFSSGDTWHRKQERHRVSIVAMIGWTRSHGEGNSLRIGQEMAFAPSFCTVRRVRTRVVPPKTARTLALSIKARSSRTAPDLPSSRTRMECKRDQTAKRVHSAKRLQHVEPLPHCNSLGMDCHGAPVFRTKTIPASVLRCGTGGRPPFDDFGGSGGSNGSICCHNISETNSAIGTPPCFSRQGISSKFRQVLK